MRFCGRFVGSRFKSVVALPFSVNGARIGVMSLASREAEPLGDQELMLLQDMIANLSFALQYRQKETTAQYLAYFDALTGLAKRSLFCERLDEALRGRAGRGGGPGGGAGGGGRRGGGN